MTKKQKTINLSDLLEWISDHETLTEDFKKHFNVSLDNVKVIDDLNKKKCR